MADSDKNFRFAITTLLVILGMFIGYIVQAERANPALTEIRIQTITNTKEIVHTNKDVTKVVKIIENIVENQKVLAVEIAKLQGSVRQSE